MSEALIPASLVSRAFFKDHLTVNGRHKIEMCDSCACRREVVRLIGQSFRKKGGMNAVNMSGSEGGKA